MIKPLYVKPFVLATLMLLCFLTACSEDEVVVPETPASTFSIRIDNVIEENLFMDLDNGPYVVTPYLVMRDLPEGEKLLSYGAFYSNVNREPDENDYLISYDISNDPIFQEWDWNEELVYSVTSLFLLIPHETYYLKGFVTTDKGVYYSNTVEISTDHWQKYTPSEKDNVIPVVFHVFDRKDGSKPNAYFFQNMIDCANQLYHNVWKLREMKEANVYFVPATHAPDGTPLETPGVHYVNEYMEVDIYGGIDALKKATQGNLWDMTKVVNVWVGDFINDIIESEENGTAGVALLPVFDPESKLEGCNTIDADMISGIFLNHKIMGYGYDMSGVGIFAHEMGHYLGLYHVFDEDYCEDTPQYDRSKYIQEQLIPNVNPYIRNPIDSSKEPYVSLNIMDYEQVYYLGITPQQVDRIHYTLEHAYLIPGGKPVPLISKGAKSESNIMIAY